MAFVCALCTEGLFEELKLPASLRNSEKMNPIGRQLIHDPMSYSALIPHPFHYSDFPDRSLSFYFNGMHFSAWEFVRRSDGPDRVEVWFEAGINEAVGSEVRRLLESAVAVLRNESICSVPIIVHQKQLPQVRVPRTAREVIPKLNKFCEGIGQINEKLLPDLKELTIQSVISTVLLPEEIELLEQHLETCGWSELSPKARELVATVLARIHERRQIGD